MKSWKKLLRVSFHSTWNINIGKKDKWKNIEEQVEEDLCREEYAENENFQDLCSVIDEFKIKKYQNDIFHASSSVCL